MPPSSKKIPPRYFSLSNLRNQNRQVRSGDFYLSRKNLALWIFHVNNFEILWDPWIQFEISIAILKTQFEEGIEKISKKKFNSYFHAPNILEIEFRKFSRKKNI